MADAKMDDEPGVSDIQLTIAKLPLAKDIADFQFDGTPINSDAGQ